MLRSKYTLLIMIIMFVGTSMGWAQPPEEINSDAEAIDYMHKLILKSDYKTLKDYLGEGANVNAVDDLGNSALHYAAKIGDRKTIDLLVEHGAIINQSNITGTTPLMMAAKYGNKYTVKKLIEHGADKSIENNSGYTAYVFARGYGRHEVADVLQR